MTDTAEPEADAPEVQSGDADKPVWWARHYTFFGTAVGLLFIFLSLTPSLLPRGPLFQGLVSGAAGATGYGLGVFGVWLVRYMRSAETSPRAPKWAWLSLLAVGIVGQILMIVYFHVWQDEIRDFMGVPRLTFWDHPLTAVLSLVVLFAFVEIGQLIRKLVRFLDLKLDRFLPPRVSAVVVVALLLALSIALLNGVVVRVAMDTINRTFAAVNDESDPDFAAPTSVLRSGGPQSLASWESLGHQGRVFVSAGPTVQQLSRFTGKPAIEPIRAYAGLHSADGIKATAALAARELQRTGGLDRAVVADVMARGFVACRAETTIAAAARAMSERRSRSLVVVSGHGRPLGVVTGFDMLDYCDAGNPTDPVTRVMHPPLTIGPEASLREAAEKMRSNRVHRLVVVDPAEPDSVPLGLISTSDLVTELATPVPAGRVG